MKKLKIVVFYIFACSLNSYCQDKIYFTAETIPVEVKIIEILQSEVKYRKFDNLPGPIYTVPKSEISKINFENGTTESYEIKFDRQKNEKLIPSSKIYLQYSETKNENNADRNDALRMARRELWSITNLILVNSIEEADFLLELKAIKKILNRKTQLTLKHLATEKIVYKSKWFSGTPTPFNAMSGTRKAIGNVIKEDLLHTFPEISK